MFHLNLSYKTVQIYWRQLKANTCTVAGSTGSNRSAVNDSLVWLFLYTRMSKSDHEKDMQDWDSGIMMCKLEFHERAELFGDHLFLNRILHALCNIWISHCWKISPQLFLTSWQLWLRVGFSHFIEKLSLWPECISHIEPDQRKPDSIMIFLLLMASVELSASGSTI